MSIPSTKEVKVKAWGVLSVKTGNVIDAFSVRDDAYDHIKFANSFYPNLKLKTIPCEITYKLPTKP